MIINILTIAIGYTLGVVLSEIVLMSTKIFLVKRELKRLTKIQGNDGYFNA